MTIDPIALTQTLVAFDTSDPSRRDPACATFLADLLAARGFEVNRHEFGGNRQNILARLPGKDKRQLPLAMSGHFDTVPVGRRPWRHDPFGAEIFDGRVFGRGTADMKAGIAALVSAGLECADQLRETTGLTLILTDGEETGCEGAAALALDQHLGAAGLLLIAEPTDNRPVIAHKGVLWLRLVAPGRAAHGSSPQLGDNAINKAARAIIHLESFAFNVAPHPALGGPTLNVGTIDGGENINSVPDSARFTADIRLIPGMDTAALRARLTAELDPDLVIETLREMSAVSTRPDDPRIIQFGAAFEKATNSPWAASSAAYFTDACVLKPALGNPATVICGPGEARLAHVTDESCSIASIHAATDIFRAAIENYTAGS